MAKKPEKATDAAKHELSFLTLRVAELTKKCDELKIENEEFRKQNVKLANTIDHDLKAKLKLEIIAKTDFKEGDLETLTYEQIEQILGTLSKVKGVDEASTYKSIRAGMASERHGRTTIGDLFNKSKKEIVEMGGDF